MTDDTTAGLAEPLDVTRDGAVATLWLNRPAKRNAVSVDMWRELAERCHALAADRSVRVVVLRGAGDHFCAGADIDGLDAGGRGAEHGLGSAAFDDANRAAEDALAELPQPTIALVTGSCVGGGASLAIACDLRIADTTARFGITPAKLGIVYPPYATERAVRLLGPSATKHLLFSGELIDGERALRIGLVDELHAPGEELETRVSALAQLLATERSALTQRASKELVDTAAAGGVVDRERAAWWAAAMVRGPDVVEGLAAFRARRAPRFTWNGPEEDQ